MLDMAFGLTDTSRLGCQVKLTKEMDGMIATLPSATRNMFVDGTFKSCYPMVMGFNFTLSAALQVKSPHIIDVPLQCLLSVTLSYSHNLTRKIHPALPPLCINTPVRRFAIKLSLWYFFFGLCTNRFKHGAISSTCFVIHQFRSAFRLQGCKYSLKLWKRKRLMTGIVGLPPAFHLTLCRFRQEQRALFTARG